MQIEVIDRFETFLRLKENWDSVYEADPEAQFFLSWTWMSKWLEKLESQWFVLAARPSAEAPAYTGFFPLRLRTKMNKAGGFFNEVAMAGNRTADYTGFICTPETQNHVIPAFSIGIQKLNWTVLNLEQLCASEDRFSLFMHHIAQADFDIREIDLVNTSDSIDNGICPRIDLPSDWETYLKGHLSANTRQKLRRFLRKVEDSDEFRITHAESATFERDLEILLRFWELKWRGRKGRRTESIQNNCRLMLGHAFENDALFLPVLWRGETPLAALATLIDKKKGSLLFFIGARDEAFDNPPPGLVLHAHSIRYAIENGFTTYDFLRGNEPYKYSFGPTERTIRHIVITTKNRQNLGDRLDRRSIPVVLRQTIALHKAGRLAEAEIGYRQILHVHPRCSNTLYGYGQLMTMRGDHRAAEALFRTLVSVEPKSSKAWLTLAQSLEAQSRFSEAAIAYREIIGQWRDAAVAHNGLGRCLIQLGRLNEALAEFDTALGLQPDDPAAAANRADTLQRLGTPSPAGCALAHRSMMPNSAMNAEAGT